MLDTQPQTLITHLSWGEMDVTIGGRRQRFKDCLIWPGGARAWDWNDTGTRHQPGIQPADLREILAHNVEVVILSRGMFLRLHTCPETEALLRQRGIEFYIEETRQAVEHFNNLISQGVRVGGVFHSTC